MINLNEPFTFENSSNPWLMDKVDDSNVLIFNRKKYTAKYLWSLNSEERKSALKNVFEYYRKNGFPKIVFEEKTLHENFEKLCKYDENKVLTKDGFISNSGNLCLDLCKYFCQDCYYDAKGGEKKTLSIKEVFNNDELFIKVLKNRMGWNSTKEKNLEEERPYLFPISDKQILNGIRNSGLGYSVSNFKPIVAKYIYSKAAKLCGYQKNKKFKVFDYSGGWTARAMGAMSLGFDYDATDPLTSKCLEKCIATFKRKDQECRIFNKCSEDDFFKRDEFKEKYDIIGSCPPYYNLEIYSSDINQSVMSCKDYKTWLENYWRNTVKNCIYMLKQNGIFVLVIKETLNKINLCDDMLKILKEEGLIFLEKEYYKTTTNHLSGKTKTGRSIKTNEVILYLQNVNINNN